MLYRKIDDAFMCIEHRSGVWQVKHVSSKGKDDCYASVPGGCALEACTSLVWRVWDNMAFHDQPSVKMVTSVEALQAVRCPCIVAPHKSPSPKP
jgi:hypothetical protein